MRPDTHLRAEGDGTTMPTMVGHFARFNEWTEINSLFEGRFLERVARRAFVKTFRENRGSMRVVFSHGQDASIGLKPLGTIKELREDDVGAYYEVPLFDTSYNRDLLPGLEAGQFGASFRFQTLRQTLTTRPPRSAHNPERLPETTLDEVKVREFGPCTFPAYQGTTAEVRGDGTHAPTRPRLERYEDSVAVSRMGPVERLLVAEKRSREASRVLRLLDRGETVSITWGTAWPLTIRSWEVVGNGPRSFKTTGRTLPRGSSATRLP
jgi:HK97 family phage prohead protease